MLSQDETAALATASLYRVLHDLAERLSPNLFQTYLLNNGELNAIYSGSSEEGYGSFSCEYLPYQATLKIVTHCDQVYEEFLSIMVDPESKPKFEEVRALAVTAMVDCAVLHLMATFETRLHHMVEDAVEDSYVVGTSMAVASIMKYLTKTQQGEFTADARPEIEKAVERSADKRRTLIRTHLNALPHILSKRGRGAPNKPQSVRDRERDVYAKRVESAYRKKRDEKGKKPTKISVAKELGEGGLNLKTGIDSSSAAFRNKLKRLGVDYDAIVQKVEDELKQ